MDTSATVCQPVHQDIDLSLRFDHLQARGLAIVPYRVLQRMGAETYSIAIHLDEEHDGERLVRSFLTGADFRLFTGLPGEGGGLIASVYLSIGVTGVSGLGPLMIPIRIAALMNTMMAATYDRFREIGIYSSVGLAPMHIAALFLAEACVYGVLGALGYLLGQTGAQDSRRPRSARRDLPQLLIHRRHLVGGPRHPRRSPLRRLSRPHGVARRGP